MKKLSLILVMALSAWMFQSCKSSTKTNGIDTIPGQPRPTVSEDDSRFAVEAAESNVADVEISDFSTSKLTNSKLKDFAAMVLKERGKANDDLLVITKPKNIMLSYALSGDGQQAEDALSQKTGSDFDKLYVSTMIEDYKKAVKLFDDAAGNVSDADIKAYAVKALPMLKKHLAAIQVIQDGMK